MGEIPFLEYRRSETAAERFLAAHDPRGELPVPIEAIVEHRLGMDILPVHDLFELIGVSGFLANDANALAARRGAPRGIRRRGGDRGAARGGSVRTPPIGRRRG